MLALYALLFLAIAWPGLVWAAKTVGGYFEARLEERVRQRTGAMRKRRPF